MIKVYDDVPVISSVRGNRLPNGQIRLDIQGKGFGFTSSEIVVTATEVIDSFPYNYLGSEIVNNYNCEYVTLSYRDAKIQCNIIPLDNYIYAKTFFVTVAANGYVSEPTLLELNLE